MVYRFSSQTVVDSASDPVGVIEVLGTGKYREDAVRAWGIKPTATIDSITGLDGLSAELGGPASSGVVLSTGYELGMAAVAWRTLRT